MNTKELGETIKNRRKELNITQPDLAELAGISVNTLYKIERGQNNPTLDVLTKINTGQSNNGGSFHLSNGIKSIHLTGT
ncbi:helix-turn-helix transcriptional regulator [bacterium]|nr:helix-turn-helix transcriptional regulator [bacterium]